MPPSPGANVYTPAQRARTEPFVMFPSVRHEYSRPLLVDSTRAVDEFRPPMSKSEHIQNSIEGLNHTKRDESTRDRKRFGVVKRRTTHERKVPAMAAQNGSQTSRDGECGSQARNGRRKLAQGERKRARRPRSRARLVSVPGLENLRGSPSGSVRRWAPGGRVLALWVPCRWDW